MNCGVGPDLMLDDIRHLSRHCRKLLSVLPNAGLPETRGDETYFPLDPDGLADWLDRFVTEFGVNIVGGCCGTTPEHLAAVVQPARRQEAGDAARRCTCRPCRACNRRRNCIVDPRPLLVGERTNTNGSRKFKQLLEKEDWHGLVEMAQEQEREGVHVLDVCIDYVGRDDVRDMNEVHQALQRRAHQAADARQHRGAGHRGGAEARAAARRSSTRSTSKTAARRSTRRRSLAKKYGAALVALTIDEKGQADTARVEVRGRQAHLRHRRQRVRHPADAICCSIRSCSPSAPARSRPARARSRRSRRSGSSSRICPGALTHVGLSNCSLRPDPVHPAGAQQRLPALRPGIRPRLGDPARGQDHAAGAASTQRARNFAAGCCSTNARSTRPATARDPLQMLIEHYADKKAEIEEGAIARRHRRGAAEAGDHPGPPRDR